MAMELTLSVIKADVGGFVGHSHMHPDLLEEARERLSTAKLHGPSSTTTLLPVATMWA